MPISQQEPVDMNLPVRRLYFVKPVSNCFSIIIILSKFGKDSRKDKYRMFGLFDNEKKNKHSWFDWDNMDKQPGWGSYDASQDTDFFSKEPERMKWPPII